MKTIRNIRAEAFLAVAVLLVVFQNAPAQVQSKVPPGQNEENWKFCGSFGQILFEGLPEASVLGEVIPGVKFTTTAGQDWLVGRWTSGKYNGKYPSGAYTSEGDAWAWLGVSQGAGVITFTQGLASYFSLFTSTIGGVTADAYDQGGNLVASSGFATNNINTGTMDKLIISRPTPDIKSVRVHDAANYWLIDSICTDAPGVSCGSLNVPDYKQFTAPSPFTWPTETYDGGGTISQYGCGLTSLVDILRSYGCTTVNGQDLNPSTLNTWLEDHKGYDPKGGVNWWAIDTLPNCNLTYNNKSVKCDPNATPTSYSTAVDEDLFEQRPVILRVRYKDAKTDEACGHFVVATGKCSNTYKINDPGRSTVHSLSDAPYLNQFFGYRSFQPGDGLSRPIVVINMHSPADVLVTSPDGKRAGFDPATGQFLSEILGSSYSDEGGIAAEDGSGVTPKYRSFQITRPVAGQYGISLFGTGTGSYQMEVITRDTSNLYATQSILGTIAAGSTQQFSMLYSPTQAGAAAITSPGRLVGGGNIGAAAVAANVSSTGTSAVGTVTVNFTAPGRQLVQSTSIRSATFQQGAANINGNCTVNGQSGYRFALSVIQNASTQVSVEVRDSKDKVVYDTSGALRGNFDITVTP